MTVVLSVFATVETVCTGQFLQQRRQTVTCTLRGRVTIVLSMCDRVVRVLLLARVGRVVGLGMLLRVIRRCDVVCSSRLPYRPTVMWTI